MDKGQSVCATIPMSQYSSLSREVERNGRSAINNRMNHAALSRQNGNIKTAERAEAEAEIMRTIAARRGFKL